MSKIGLNISLGSIGDETRLLRVLRGMKKSRVHTIFTGGTEYAKERRDVIRFIEKVGRNDCLYVHRYFSNKQGDWRAFQPEVMRYIWSEIQAHPQIITETFANEPDATESPEFVANQQRHLRYANERGHAFGVGCWGVGGPHEFYIDNGGFDGIWKDVVAANQKRKGSAYVTSHEYHYVWPEAGAGFDDIPYEVLLAPAELRRFMKSKAEWDIRKRRWLIRTSDWQYVHARDTLKLDVSLLPFIFTEYGWDGVDNPITYLNHLTLMSHALPAAIAKEFGISQQGANWLVTGFADRLRDKYLVRPYNGLRGVGAQRHILKAIFPELSFENAVRLILTHYNHDILWPAHIIGATLFGWIFHGEWGGEDNSSGHNYGDEGLDDVLIDVGSLNDDTTEPEPEYPPLIEKIIRGKDGRVNIRNGTDTTYDIKGQIPVTFVTVMAGETVKPDWWYIEWDGLTGFINHTFIEEYQEPEPPPDPKLTPDDVRQILIDIESILDKYS